jgi:hypothetical protein
MTPAINLCHGFSVIGGVIDTGDKFITGVVDTAEQLSPVSLSLKLLRHIAVFLLINAFPMEPLSVLSNVVDQSLRSNI